MALTNGIARERTIHEKLDRPDSVFVIRGRSAIQNQYSVVRIRASTIACWYNKRCINTWRLSFFPPVTVN